MRKLVLDLDRLEVESFEVSEDQAERGTVRGQEEGAQNASDTWCRTNCISAPCFCHISEAGCG